MSGAIKRIHEAKAKLGSEHLDEMVHEVFSVNASNVNNQGLDAQVDTLIHWCGEEETATILEDIVRELEGMKK